MLRKFVRGGVAAALCSDPDVVWLDLLSPTEAEEQEVEGALEINVPTPAERAAFEESSRFYEEGGALFLTATLLGRRNEGPAVSGPVTFILTKQRLVTVRQINPRAFDVGEGRASARLRSAASGADVLFALLEGAAERLADLIADNVTETNLISTRIFDRAAATDPREIVRDLGRIGTLAALTHDSLASLKRLLAFARVVRERHALDVERIDALARDAAELERVVEALQPRLAFLQDATLGLINASQTNVLKALSLATIAFVPPTLIASIFGMNFEAMTWFRSSWGPWAAAALMILAPAALFTIAKWRRWF